MARTQFTRDERELSGADQHALLDVAEQSIQYGLETGRVLDLDVASYAENLRSIQASFVTLRIGNQLRGCVGSIEPAIPLVVDVCRHAFAAATVNTRFPGVRSHEFPQVATQVSILSTLEKVPAGDLAETLQHLRAGSHGVVVRLGERRATFLPDVWESLPDPVEFLRHLRLKAGLDPEGWSAEIEVSTYTTQRFSRSQPRASHPNLRSEL
jgi:AmmeMemoRadiSam system protein A